ncbi:Nitrous oxide reductase accessory protein NosL [Malonomonas rubra DSM 5091]|uniref:Nitrous oxide reductase accessory protein NosL n=2 Tax=Malonomonas rubra TaxID=57040 RepID=A0A1M6H7T7_MALRU|nr:Nitrous oxide reductase accessory protein NosL [Malonomonas rubra DSM 5091]
MKKLLVLFSLLMLAVLPAIAEQFADQHEHKSCSYCGMNRVKFAHSRMLIEYEKADPVATCSIHCSAIDLAVGIEKTPKKIQVADYNSHQLIDAESAHWVVGGKKKGVMTMRAKWAFADKKAAEAFVAENGGIIIDFDHAMRAAYEDMYKDTTMIRKKRQMKKMKIQQMKKGEM